MLNAESEIESINEQLLEKIKDIEHLELQRSINRFKLRSLFKKFIPRRIKIALKQYLAKKDASPWFFRVMVSFLKIIVPRGLRGSIKAFCLTVKKT